MAPTKSPVRGSSAGSSHPAGGASRRTHGSAADANIEAMFNDDAYAQRTLASEHVQQQVTAISAHAPADVANLLHVCDLQIDVIRQLVVGVQETMANNLAATARLSQLHSIAYELGRDLALLEADVSISPVNTGAEPQAALRAKTHFNLAHDAAEFCVQANRLLASVP
jgi:hypothetical protein